MVATYSKDNLKFSYPDSWSVSEESPAHPLVITAQSTQTGFWTLHVYPSGHDRRELLEEAVRAIRNEYESVETITRLAADQTPPPASGAGYDLQFYCLDLLVAARIQVYQAQDCTLLVVCQAEDREFQQLEPVFEAMTSSLLESL